MAKRKCPHGATGKCEECREIDAYAKAVPAMRAYDDEFEHGHPGPVLEDYRGLPVPRATIYNKEHERTCWVELVFHEADDKFMTKARAVLKEAGWEQDRYAPVPPLHGVQDLDFCKPGADLFGGWTDVERRTNLRGIRKALDKLGIPVYRATKTLADLL